MRFTTTADDGAALDFECADTFISRWVNGEILAGKTYPYLPFVDDVRVIFDVGANCGATSVYFAHHYPDAEIHAFEPGSEPRAYLERNAAAYPNIRVHPFGLHTADEQLPLYRGTHDTITASLHRRSANLDEHELVEVRAAGPWAAANGIDRIDVLKVDVEGSEIEVLESLHAFLPAVRVLYLEYDSRQARRALARLLDDTHELYRGMEFLDTGECLYLRKDLADHPDANPTLLALFRGEPVDGQGSASARSTTNDTPA